MVNLSFAGASDRTITTSALGTSVRLPVGMAIRLDPAIVVGGFGDRWDFHVLHINQSLSAGVAAWTSGLGGLLVGGKIEGDKEEEIGAQDAHAGKSGKFLTGAAACIRSRWEVSMGEISVGSKVNEA